MTTNRFPGDDYSMRWCGNNSGDDLGVLLIKRGLR